MLALILAVGIAVGMIGDRVLNAQQKEPVKRTVLLKTDLAGLEGKEGVVYIAELAPGVAAGKHYHPGQELGYVLAGSLTLEQEGKPPATFKAGQAFTNPPKIVHDAKNPNTKTPAKVLVVLIAEKGQPLATPVK